MSDENSEKSTVDPIGQMIQFYDAMSKSWAKAMSDAVSSKGFAESVGQQLEGSLETMTVMRRQFTDLFEQYLQQMNLPTRKEIVGLADRLTRMEMAMDDLDAKLDKVLDHLEKEE
jgi:hypothetical protein